MVDVSGSAMSRVQSQTVMGVPGEQDRLLSMATLVGMHSSADATFDKARITYVGTAETVNGSGKQIGYFHNIHANGDTSQGTYDAEVTTSATTMRLDGSWRFSGGTGRLAGIKGGGSFQSEMTSPTEAAMSWDGAYELA